MKKALNKKILKAHLESFLSSFAYKIILNPLFSGSATMILGSNSTNFLNYLYHLVMIRLLGPNGYGELASLISIIGLIGVIPSSVSLVVIKYVSSAKDEGEVSSLVGYLKNKTLKVSILIFLMVLLISPFINSFLHISKNVYLVFIAISFLFSLPSVLNRAILQGLLKFKEMVLSVLVENSSKLFLGIILVYVGFGVSGAIVGFVLSIIIGWFLTTLFIKYKKSKQYNPDLKPMILFTIPVIIQAVSTTSLYSSDLILVKHFFSSYEAGLYASISTLGKIIFFATGPISAVMFPLVSKRLSEGANYRKIFMYSFLLTALFAGGLLFIYWLIPQQLISLLGGSSYIQAAYLLGWFGLFISFFTLSSLLINFNLSLGKTKVVIFPLIAAIAQIIMIWLYHQTLFIIVLISIIITALLLVVLLIYSTYGNRFNFNNSPLI